MNVGVLACMLTTAVWATGCDRGDTRAPGEPPAPTAIQVGAENVVTVTRGTLVVGPLLSGELRAERSATVRAELGGAMLEVLVEEGQPVRRGALLGRINARALADTRQSTASAVRSAETQLAVAQREAERTAQLVAAGALAQRDLDLARSSVSAAEAQLADARARLASAETSLGDAIIRAPIAGVVSNRAVNAGDVVSPGTELFTIIDPSSMRLEAAVPSDDLRALRAGAAVQFRVRGYDEAFEGRVVRIAPQADASTRQVPIFVSVPNAGGRLVAGLFAEGRVVTAAAEGLTAPSNAVNTTTDMPWVLRVRNGKAEKVAVTLGLTDPRTEQLQIASGVADGDVLLRGAAQGITPGTAVQVGGAE